MKFWHVISFFFFFTIKKAKYPRCTLTFSLFCISIIHFLTYFRIFHKTIQYDSTTSKCIPVLLWINSCSRDLDLWPLTLKPFQQCKHYWNPSTKETDKQSHKQVLMDVWRDGWIMDGQMNDLKTICLHCLCVHRHKNIFIMLHTIRTVVYCTAIS